ncbi:multidrug effflux MFS transporter [Advenella mimigardefordensis]|uniref:Bcr/CflA family efflux transporter n=1 Tax=Advenella mimigardefordensis (strain DSM 17166 / LMG 22922 / DPN7) TaxID=1247726 RepID=W0PEN6_ADVMD|nr:multidrug effflux MFS transporter [Advenella mimigardefordensis]AHG65429.1 drug resistance transporter, Bcr/CflA subfamily [Advenella mimigardefordensis DPN7]
MTDISTTETQAIRTKNSDSFYAFLIVALAPIGQMGIDIFTPSLPLIAKEFMSSRETVQLRVSLYLAAFSIGQLFYGPLSDSIGRRRALVLGLVLFLTGSLIAITASNIEVFITGRVIQGFGITCASVLMRAIATDMFKPPQLASVLTYMVVGWGMGPIIAPVIGAAFQETIGWKYSLIFLAVYAVILLALIAFVMKETNRNLVAFSLTKIASGVGEIYGNFRFTLIFLSMGFCYGVILCFNLVGPFVVQEAMGYSPGTFGVLALAMGLVYFLGVLSNRVMPAAITPARKFSIASLICVIAAAIQLSLALVADLNIWALAVPFAFVVFFCGVMYPNLMAMGVSAFPHIAGLASSLLGFSLMLLAAAIMWLSSLMQAHSLLPFATLTLVLMCGVFVMIRAIRP